MERIGRYQIEGKLGNGGMGSVYKAKDPESGKTVAIKVLLGQLSGDHLFITRFFREVEVMRKLNHPNIIAILDHGEHSGFFYFVMEYAEGLSLRRMLDKQKVLPVADTLGISIQLAEVLSYVHRQGIIHRDVKPSNVFLMKQNKVKLGDFGVVKPAGATRLTSTGGIVGSPFYMSPEQAKGEVPGPESDLYSLGVILYEMTTGRLPFSAKNPVQLVQMQRYHAPEKPSSFNPEVSEELSSVIMQLIEKDPDRRIADADIAGKILRTFLSDSS